MHAATPARVHLPIMRSTYPTVALAALTLSLLTPAQAAPPAKPAPKPAAKAAKAAKATDPAADRVVAKIQRFYSKIRDYSADFVQTYHKAALSQTRVRRGTLDLKRPDKVRWVYRQPQRKLWLVDGRRLLVLDPEFEQAYLNPHFDQDEVARSIGFLWGDGKLKTRYKVRMGDAAAYRFKAPVVALELRPKQSATYRKVVLGVLPSGEVVASVVYETVGNTDRFEFSNSKQNQGLKNEIFQLKPPKGWELIQP